MEQANQGNDYVASSISYTLTANVEALLLTGTAVLNATGNTLNNILVGNSAANVLDGRAGADTMAGGQGDDTYVVDNGGDVVTENAGEGVDIVQSSITHVLAANVENLTLTGTAAINGTGNALDNVITGNGAGNRLSGAAGNDTFIGGRGQRHHRRRLGVDPSPITETSRTFRSPRGHDLHREDLRALPTTAWTPLPPSKPCVSTTSPSTSTGATTHPWPRATPC